MSSITESTMLAPVDSRSSFRQRQHSLDKELRLLKTESIIDALPEGFNIDSSYEPNPPPHLRRSSYVDTLPEGFLADESEQPLHPQLYNDIETQIESQTDHQSSLSKVIAFLCCHD